MPGNGDGTFGYSGIYQHGGYGAASVHIGDFTGDGQPDVVTSDGWLLRGIGDSYCSLQNPQPTTIASGIVDKGDFDRDGNLDLLTRSNVMLGNGDGTFHLAEWFSAQEPVAGDVNADGKLDIVGIDMVGINDSRVWVVLGHGDGTFAAPMIMTLGTPTDHSFSSAALADFDGDR